VRPLFLDTGFVIALEAVDDQHHRAAQACWERLWEPSLHLVTTTYVFDEVVTFFNGRGHFEKAVDIGTRLLESPSVRVVHVDEALFEEGWRALKVRPDKRYSLTDCISFVVMSRENLREALAFDRHFEQAGFLRLPDLAG
jgi:predicted nucleic acid-binding protein